MSELHKVSVFFNYLRKLLELNSSSFSDFSDEETISGDASLLNVCNASSVTQVSDTSPERY